MLTQKFGGLRAILAFDNWPALLLVRLFDRKAGFVAYRKKGLDILIDHRGGDENGIRQCIASHMYSNYLPSFVLRQAVRVIDLGANGGGFPLMLKIAGIEIARVVSVEMNPLTFLRLQLNLGTNLGDAAVAVNAAVCGSLPDTPILLKPSRGSTGQSMYDNGNGSTAPSVPVKATTLKALCDQYFGAELVDICKIDIEGAEYELFEFTPDEVLCKIRYLIVEFHDPPRTPPAVARLAALGFTEITIEEARRTGDRTEVRVFRGPAA